MHAGLLKTASSIKSLVFAPASFITPRLKGCTVQRNIAYGKLPAQHFDLYRTSDAGNRPLPVIVVIHGGGWVIGHKRERATFCTNLAQEGYAVFSINYRLAPRHPFPAGVTDVLLALDWINEHAAAYGGNAAELAVVGDSAGAHLASLAVAGGDNRKLYGVDASAARKVSKLILYYGIYNLRSLPNVRRPHLMTYLRSLTGTTDMQRYTRIDDASPIMFAKHFPATLVIASEVDPLYSQSTELIDALKQAHVSYKTALLNKADFPRARHGFQSLPNSKAEKAALAAIIRFLAA